MTAHHLIFLVLGVIGVVTLFSVGWRQQSTLQDKETYMLKWLQLVANLAPFILASVPGVPSALIPLVVTGIQEAQKIHGATGPEKKAHVMAIVATGLKAANVTHPVIDETAATVAVSSGIDATISAMKAIQSVTKSVPAPKP